jgi:hypothetical protein
MQLTERILKSINRNSHYHFLTSDGALVLVFFPRNIIFFLFFFLFFYPFFLQMQQQPQVVGQGPQWMLEVYGPEGKPIMNGPTSALTSVNQVIGFAVVFVQKGGNDVKAENCLLSLTQNELENAMNLDSIVVDFFPTSPPQSTLKVFLLPKQAGKVYGCLYPPLKKAQLDRLVFVVKNASRLSDARLVEMLANLDFRSAAAIVGMLEKEVTAASSQTDQAVVPSNSDKGKEEADTTEEGAVEETKKKGGKKSTGSKITAKDRKDSEFTAFYVRIFKSMKENRLLQEQNGGKRQIVLMIDPNLSLEQFIKNKQNALDALLEFVRSGFEAVQASQHVALVNAIIQGQRLFQVKNFWEEHKTETFFRQQNITKWESFLKHMRIGCQVSHADGLIRLYLLSVKYPNIWLVTDCYPSEIITHHSRLVKHLQINAERDAEEWALSGTRSFEFRRETTFLVEGGGPIAPPMVQVTAPNTMENWERGCAEYATKALEEDAVEKAKKKAANAEQKKEKTIGGLMPKKEKK